MNPKRRTRRLTTLTLGASLIVSLLAVPWVATAAVPNWRATVEKLPATVTPGADAGYRLTVTNDGPGNISQLYLFAEGAPAPSYSAPSQGTCQNPNGSLFCSLGSLGDDQSATIVVAFPTPAGAASAFTVDFFFNTTGLGSGGGDSSHGDALHVPASTALSGDADFAGRFVVGDRTVANAAIAGTGNQMSTKVIAPAVNIPATVADEDMVVGNPACPAGFTCVIGTSQLNVAGGAPFPSLFQVVIQIDKTALRGISVKSLDVLHILDDPVPPVDLPDCPRRGAPTTDCATVVGLPGGHAQATLWLSENGYVKFH